MKCGPNMMECVKAFYLNNSIVKIKWTKINKMNKIGRPYIWCVTAYVCLYLPRHYEYPGYRSKLVQLYSNSSLYTWILRKVVVFGSCLLHVGTCDYSRVMLCYAGVLAACFACGNSTFLKHLKIELSCVCVCVCACMVCACAWRVCMVCVCMVCVCVHAMCVCMVCACAHAREVSLYGTVKLTDSARTHAHTPKFNL